MCPVTLGVRLWKYNMNPLMDKDVPEDFRETLRELAFYKQICAVLSKRLAEADSKEFGIPVCALPVKFVEG